MRLFTFLLLALSSPVFCQAATSNNFPVTVLDDRNKSVVFQEKPRSIASVSAFGADLLTALGKQATGIFSINHKLPTYLGNMISTRPAPIADCVLAMRDGRILADASPLELVSEELIDRVFGVKTELMIRQEGDVAYSYSIPVRSNPRVLERDARHTSKDRVNNEIND